MRRASAIPQIWSVTALVALLGTAAPPRNGAAVLAQGASWTFETVRSITNTWPACTGWGVSLLGLGYDRAGEPAVGWTQWWGCGGVPAPEWGRRDGGAWGFHKINRIGGERAQGSRSFVVAPDGTPWFGYIGPHDWETRNLYVTDLSVNPDGAPYGQIGSAGAYVAVRCDNTQIALDVPPTLVPAALMSVYCGYWNRGLVLANRTLYEHQGPPTISYGAGPQGQHHLIFGSGRQAYYRTGPTADDIGPEVIFATSPWHELTTSTAVDANNTPHVAVAGVTTCHGSYALQYSASSDGTAFTQSWVDPLGGSGPSLQLDAGGTPHIAYWRDSRNLRYASLNANGTWSSVPVVTLAGGEGNAGGHLAFDPVSGNPGISFYDRSRLELRIASGGASDLPPVVTPITAFASTEGGPVTLQVAASDPEGQPLTYQMTASGSDCLDTGISINASTGLIGGTVAVGATARSPYRVAVIVSDAAGNSTVATFTWTVTANRPPVLTNPGPQISDENTSPSLAIAATDPDGDLFTFTASGLPPGLAIHPATGVISGTVSYEAARSYDVTVTVGDGHGHTASIAFTWAVNDVNRGPTIASPGDQQSDEGTAPTLAIGANDADSDALTFGATGLPPGLSIDANTGVIGGPLGYDAAGSYTVTVTVSDGRGGTAQTSFTWHVVDPNHAPVTMTSGPDFGVSSIGPLEIPLTAAGGDGVSYTWSIVSGTLPPGMALRTDKPSSFPAAASAGLIGVATTPGTYAFTLRVASAGRSANQNATLEITALVPRESVAPDAFVGEPYSQQLGALNATATPSWSAPTDLPPGLTVSSAGLISGTPTAAGSYRIGFALGDGVDIVQRTVTLTVGTLHITTPGLLPQAWAGLPYTATIEAAGGVAPYSFTAWMPQGLSLSATGVISGAVTNGSNGPNVFTVTVTDANNTSATKLMTIVSSTGPQWPAIGPAGGFFADCTLGAPCLRAVSLVEGGIAPFTWTATGLPPGMFMRTADTALSSEAGPADGELWGIPTALGEFDVIVTVADAQGRMTTNTFPLRVSPLQKTSTLPNAFVATPYSSAIRVIGGVGPYTGQKIGRPWQWPFGISVDVPTFTMSGGTYESGRFKAPFRYVDANGASLTIKEALIVESTGMAIIRPDARTADFGDVPVGQWFSYSFHACCGGPQMWSLPAGAVPGLTIDAGGTLSGIPLWTGEASAFVTVQSSPASVFGMRRFRLNVTPMSISYTGSLSGTVGTPYAHTFSATGGTGSLTWTLSPDSYLPPGLTWNANGTLSGTPTATGRFVFSIIATDEASNTARRWVALTIYPAGGGPPLLHSQGPDFGTASIGPLEIPLVATGGDGVSYAWSHVAGELPPGMQLRTDNPSTFPSNASAGLIGVAFAEGTYTFTLRVSSGGQSVDQTATIRIARLVPRETAVPDAFVGEAYSYQLGDLPNLGTSTWSLPANLPPGMSLSNTGLLSGTPTAAGSFSIGFTLSNAFDSVRRAVNLSVNAVAITTPGMLPNATQGTAYSTTVAAGGGVAPYTFTAQCCVPAGLAMSPDGVISGTPLPGLSGRIGFNVTVTDAAGVSYTKAMSITVVTSPPELMSIAPYNAYFDDCTLGAPCHRGVGVTAGGAAPFTWTAAGLPSGMAIRTGSGLTSAWVSPGDAEIHGTPTSTGRFDVTVAVTDATGATTSNTFPLNVSVLLQTNSLPAATPGVPYAQTLRVIGYGAAFATAQQIGGRLPAGITFDGTTRTVAGTTTESGSGFAARIEFETVAGTLRTTSPLTVTGGPLLINTTAHETDLRDAPVGVPYAFQFSACCASGMLWSIAGGTAPPGLALSAGGLLSGTPTVAGVYAFLVRVEDAGNPAIAARRQFTLNVTPVAVNAAPLPGGIVTVPYSVTLSAAGQGARLWSLVPPGYLPPGLTLSAAGVLSGTPGSAGRFLFSVRVDDGEYFATRAFAIDIFPDVGGAPVVHSQGPDVGTHSIGRLEIPLAATGGNGAVYTWSIVGGTLPPGMALRTDKPPHFPAAASAGLIGVATTPGTYTFALRVQSGGQSADQNVTIRITALVPREAVVPDAFVGRPYSYQLGALHASGPATWTAPTDLPAGLTLSNTGLLSGTPAAPAQAHVGFSLGDDAHSVQRAVSLTVRTVRITTASLPNAVAGAAYSATVAAAGGTAPYTFTARCCLPSGLSLSASGVISGSVNGAPRGPTRFEVTVTDASNASHTRTLSIDVLDASPMLPAVTGYASYGAMIDDCTVGVPCHRGIGVAAGGKAPFTWTASGLPPGMSIRFGSGTSDWIAPGDLELWGTPTALGVFFPTFTVSDADGKGGSNTFRLGVFNLLQTNSLPDATSSVPYSQAMRVIGGMLGYAGEIERGRLPQGIAFNPSTFAVTGTTAESGAFEPVFAYREANGSGNPVRVRQRLFVASSGLAIDTDPDADLGDARVGSPYSHQFSACCAPAMAWSAVNSVLPDGLTLSPAGLLSGSPGVAGLYTFTIRVEDATDPSRVAIRRFKLNVTPVVIDNMSLPDGKVGVPYSLTLTGTGIVSFNTVPAPPYSALPPGLWIDGGDDITGTPTTSGQFLFTITGTDAAGRTATRRLSIVIHPDLTHTQPSDLGTHSIGRIEIPLAAAGGDGSFLWSLVDGSLPPGVAVRHGHPLFPPNTSTKLAGIATEPGTYTFTLRVASAGQSADRFYSLTITPLTLKEFDRLPDAFVGVPYSYTFTPLGGDGPVTFSGASGVPAGMTLSPDGVLSGTPLSPAKDSITFSITDGIHTIVRTVMLPINAVRITTPGVLPNATQHAPYTATIAAEGGAGGYTFSAEGLPAGLSMNEAGVITGTMSGPPGPVSFRVTATDATRQSYRKAFAIDLMGTLPALFGISVYERVLDDCSFGVGCIQRFGVWGGGVAPFTWTANGLPPGMSIRQGTDSNPNDAELWGTATALGTFNVQLSVMDSAGATTTQTFPLRISALFNAAPPMPGGAIGEPYSHYFFIIGGDGTVTATATVQQTGAEPPLPGGLGFDGAEAVSGTPVESGSFTPLFTFTSSGQTQTLRAVESFRVDGGSPAVKIDTPADLGSVDAGSPYVLQLSACCAVQHTWTLSGGELPPGITLSAGGELSGTPAAVGSYTFLIKAADATNAAGFGARLFTLHVAAGTALRIAGPDTIPDGFLGIAYAHTFAATGGSGPLTWTVAPYSFLPPGLTVDSGGHVSGIPASSGRYQFQISVTDGSQTATRLITLATAAPAPPISFVIAPSGGVFRVGRIMISLSASGGAPPYRYSYTPDATAIPGLRVQTGPPLHTLDPAITGALFGVITAGGSYTTSLRVTDSANRTVDRPLTLTVEHVRVTSKWPPTALLGVPYSFPLSAAGGIAPYTWSLTSGSLPSGLTLDPASGLISGTPSASGVSFVRITATDAGGNPASQDLTLAVEPFAIASGALPPATVGVPYSFTLSATGCTDPCVWQALDDPGDDYALPDGLVLSATGVLSGTPAIGADRLHIVLIRATAAGGAHVDTSLLLIVRSATPQPLQIVNGPTRYLTVGSEDDTFGILEASGGAPPYAWSVESGTLPPGILMRPGENLGGDADFAAGLTYFTGAPMQLGMYTFAVRVTDSLGETAVRELTWVVSPLDPKYYSNLPIAGTLAANVPYTQPLLGLGGTTPYTWMANGEMPAGLTLSSDGTVGGTPTAPGRFDVRVQMTDAAAHTFVTTVRFTIDGATISGAVTDAVTGSGLAGVVVELYRSDGTFATSTVTDPLGHYMSPPLPGGTYFARTVNVLGYADVLYNNLPCIDPGCHPMTGTGIVVSTSDVSGIDFVLSPASVPTVTTIEPTFVSSGSAAFTLTVNGAGFAGASVVRLDSVALTTTFISTTQLTAQVPASSVSTPGVRSITVLNPAPGGGTSNSLVLTVTPPPAITAIGTAVVPGGPISFTITNAPGNQFDWVALYCPDTSPSFNFLAFEYLNGRKNATVTFTLPTSIVPGTMCNGRLLFDNSYVVLATSQSITVEHPVPILRAISPARIVAASSAFAVTVTGANFFSSSVVRVNGAPRPTAFIGATELTASIGAADVATAGSNPVITVFNPTPGGGTSGSLTLTVVTPTIVAAANVNPGGTMTFTAAEGPGNIFDRVALYCPHTSPDGSFSALKYLNNSTTPPSTPLTGGTVTFTAPTTPAMTCNARFQSGETDGVMATSATVSVNNPVPTITSVSPASVYAGSGAFTLTVFGTSFVSGSSVRASGAARPTVFVSSTQLTAAIPATDLATVGALTITVFNPPPGGATSNPVTLAVPAPPTITAGASTVVPGGTIAFTVANGPGNQLDWVALYCPDTSSNFSYVAFQYLNGQTNATVTFTMPLSVAAGTTCNARVLVNNGYDSVATSGLVTVANPVPVIGALVPTSVFAGSATFTLTVTGSNFVTGSAVRVNGAPRPTSFENTTQLTASISESDVATAGSNLTITVFNPTPGGGTSDALTLTVAPSTAIAAGASTVTPGSAIDFSVVNGPGNQFDWVGLYCPGTNPNHSFITFQYLNGQSNATVTFTMPPAVAPGTTCNARVLADNTYTSVATSGLVTVTNPVPAISALNPSTVTAGSAAFTVTVTGSSFVNGSALRVNGSSRPTGFGSATRLTATIAAADVAAAGNLAITVFNPTPGGGTSDALTLTVTPSTAIAAGASTVTPGGTIDFSVVNGPANQFDWVGLYCPDTNPNTSYRSFQYLNGQTNATVTFTIPTSVAPGTACNARVLVNNGYTSVATSGPVMVANPVPAIGALNPSAVQAGGAAFTLTVTGSSFVSGSVVRLNGASRPTAFVSATQLTATIGTADVANAGNLAITVFNPTPGGGSSGGSTLTVTAAATVVASATTVTPGGAISFAVTNGPGNQFDWVGFYCPETSANTAYVAFRYLNGQTSGTATFTAPNLSGTTCNGRLLVNNGYTSIATSGPVTIRNPGPEVWSLSPNTVTAGSGAFTLTVIGGNFESGFVVRLNGASRPTTFVSSTQLTATIAAADVATAGNLTITVFNPTLGVTSPGLTLTVTSATTITATQTSVGVGGTMTFNVANGPGGAFDWVGLYCPATAANTGYVAYRYVNGQANATVTFTAPAAPTTCQARLLPNNGYTDVARSGTVTIVSSVAGASR